MTGSKARPTLASVVAPNPEVAFRAVDGEMVLLDLETGTYFGLDQVGARVWTLLADGGRLGDVLSALHAEYEVDAATLERDLLALVGELCARGLTRVVAA